MMERKCLGYRVQYTEPLNLNSTSPNNYLREDLAQIEFVSPSHCLIRNVLPVWMAVKPYLSRMRSTARFNFSSLCSVLLISDSCFAGSLRLETPIPNGLPIGCHRFLHQVVAGLKDSLVGIGKLG
jgi:hypothetical protein